MSEKSIYRVIGAQRSKGNFQGYSYDNVVFFVSRPCSAEDPDEAAGVMQSDRVKKPWSFIISNDYKLEDFLGLSCRVYYDRYGKPCDIEFEGEDEPYFL